LPKLQAFCANVAALLKPGGVFLGTTLDGAKLHALFAQHGTAQGERVTGSASWYIRKLYPNAHFEAPNPLLRVGAAVDTFMETFAAPQREFLVHIDTLDAVLAQHGIVPPPPALLQSMGLKSHTETFDRSYDSLAPLRSDIAKMTASDRIYSFLNRWFVYVKAAPP
jgi:hypothetical protein